MRDELGVLGHVDLARAAEVELIRVVAEELASSGSGVWEFV